MIEGVALSCLFPPRDMEVEKSLGMRLCHVNAIRGNDYCYGDWTHMYPFTALTPISSPSIPDCFEAATYSHDDDYL